MILASCEFGHCDRKDGWIQDCLFLNSIVLL